MIRSFRHKGLRRFYENDDHRGVNSQHREKLRDILARLDVATSPADMDFPGFRMHPLAGDWKGFFGVTVRANWRVVFRFEDGDAVEIDYLDYH
jgi:toxin HigB-1